MNMQQQQQFQSSSNNGFPANEAEQRGMKQQHSQNNINLNNQIYGGTNQNMHGSKSSGGLPYLAGARSQQPQQPVRSSQEKEGMLKHLIQPTKSQVLRQQIVAQYKKEQYLMYLKNSRILDNHFAPKIHSSPWISPGLALKPKYQADATGLSLTFGPSDFENLLNQEKQEVSKLKEQGFRNWSEYETIRDKENIITIEYCTNCQDHQGSTRHDEKKYEYIAANLKKELMRHFPDLKIYMKPLITEAADKSISNQFARSRLGAMEVQLCQSRGGKIEKNILFSKLQTKQWPSTLAVLNELRKYMGKCTLKVQLMHEIFDPENLSEDKQNKSDNKLLNIEVTLRPYRRLNSAASQANFNNTTISGYNSGVQSQLLIDNNNNNNNLDRSQHDLTSIKSRPNSGLFRRSSLRPISAQSMFTVQSYSKLPQKEGFSVNSISIKEKTNSAGIAIFKDLPIDVYSLEIKENNDFRSTRDQIDVFKKIKITQGEQQQQQQSDQQEEEKDAVYHQVHLEHVDLTFAKFLLDPLPNPEAHPKESRIRVFKEGDEDNELDEKITKEFETTLDPGIYTVIVEHPVCGTIQQQHEFQFGTQEMRLSWDGATASQVTQPKKSKRPPSARPQSGNNLSQKELTIQVIDAKNQRELIQNCKIEINDDVKGMQSYFTDKQGQCVVRLDGFTKGYLKLKHEEFLEINEEYGPTTTMNLNKMKDLTLPLIRKPQSENEINLLVSTDAEKKVMTVHIICPDGTELTTSKGNVTIDNTQETSQQIKINRIKETKGVYRIFAKVHDISLLSPQLVKFYVITSANSMNIVEVPKNHPNLQGKDIYWDIGVLLVPEGKFMEINGIQSEKVSQFQDLQALKQISDALVQVTKRPSSAKGNVELRNLFGFPQDDPKVLQNNNDFLVQKDQVVSSIVKNIFNGQGNDSIDHLIHSALMTNGLYSFSKLKQKFENMSFPETATLERHRKEGEDGEDDEEYEQIA